MNSAPLAARFVADPRISKRVPSALAWPWLLVAFCVVLTGCKQTDAAPPKTVAIEINGHAFDMELALDDDQRLQGLSDRSDIPESTGMLFAFPDVAMHQFVMRRCLVPIDIVFLDGNGRVTASHAMAVEDADANTPEWQLTRYSSKYPAQYALEFSGGTLGKLDLEEGDPVNLPFEDLKRWAK